MSILHDTKTYLGLMDDDPSFDSEVKDAIDNALATATQLNHEVGDLSSEADYPAWRLTRLRPHLLSRRLRL